MPRSAAHISIPKIVLTVLAGLLFGGIFRPAAGEEREHGPPFPITANAADAASDLLSLAPPLASLSAPASTLLQPSIHSATPHGIELPHALVERSLRRSVLGMREHYAFTTAALDTEQRQRQQVAIHLGRAVSRRGDQDTAERIATIYESLRPAHWGHHADGFLGGHFNFDYSAVECVNLDRLLPHRRYGTFASLHFHHDQERVHVDTANPFGIAGLLAPVHIFVDVVGGHLFWNKRLFE